ncbi:MAG: co-chaperone GroES [Planctomycetes bacterium RIFCSPHIGHO2_02_FULL_50_42]|nr:co-chaperone GroES [Candidatus Brocadiales bacterium]OHB38423.1 MAG: co-chaperone GroES [Planctomycetes bacterium GWA2_50_13]OHB89960.1 MAG: co-chaperone GroES [Planctomycetes bacterium RIFCSPHIGHO2_02_FULL_50_42]OHB92550.1 MAG: co-chaperone GroES [Planctomycetes bacterium RIFCSPHIGHO2_12_FULL_51_37]OHB96328.1 MAG: co-chaperone GroES [Planctomycetes bacterium RIFCSPLOWO2_02_FULL_50_16]OHC02401.1 MAG: co-chaperone GroES [Planctomycetes bacterium RIFCSPLOWO2_12_FULL_50_35]HCN19604.1 co-chape
MSIRPLDDRVVIERLEAEEKTAGGILLPDTAKEKPSKGKVIAVGDGRLSDDGKKIPLSVKKGDKVFFSKYAGAEVTVDGKEYLIMKESDILAKIEG